MRLAVLVVVLLLVSGAVASAASWPPPAVPQTVHVMKLERFHARSIDIRTCMKRSKIARWLAPVACEQPPRSELLISVLFGD